MECWRVIEGYEGRYEVSDLGRVRSLPRTAEWVGRGGVQKLSVEDVQVIRTSRSSVAVLAEQFGVSMSTIYKTRSGTRRTSRNNSRSLGGHVLKQRLVNGYPLVKLSKDNAAWHIHVHRLVLTAFRGPCPEGLVGCHNNDVRTDNRLENLRWDTSSANVADSIVNGKHPNTNKTHCPQGHPYTIDNIYFRTLPDGRRWRQCRECQHDSRRRRLEHRDLRVSS